MSNKSIKSNKLPKISPNLSPKNNNIPPNPFITVPITDIKIDNDKKRKSPLPDNEEDEDEEDEEEVHHGGRGRKKIDIKKIEDIKTRQVTFNKRRIGLMKKAMELAILCDCHVGLLVFHGDKLYQYGSHDMDVLFQKYAQFEGSYEALTNNELDGLRPGKASSFHVGIKKRKVQSVLEFHNQIHAQPMYNEMGHHATAPSLQSPNFVQTPVGNTTTESSSFNSNYIPPSVHYQYSPYPTPTMYSSLTTPHPANNHPEHYPLHSPNYTVPPTPYPATPNAYAQLSNYRSYAALQSPSTIEKQRMMYQSAISPRPTASSNGLTSDLSRFDPRQLPTLKQDDKLGKTPDRKVNVKESILPIIASTASTASSTLGYLPSTSTQSKSPLSVFIFRSFYL